MKKTKVMLLWVRKGGRSIKMQGLATAWAPQTMDFVKYAAAGRGKLYIVEAVSANAARAIIKAGECREDEEHNNVFVCGGLAWDALIGSERCCESWDKNIEKAYKERGRKRIADADTKPLNFVGRDRRS